MESIVNLTGDLAARTAPHSREVHLWRAPLDVPPQLAARFAVTLSDDEHERAERLRGARDRSRYAAGHGWLRHLIAGYLGADPGGLAFVVDARGKPGLVNSSAPWLRFNLSHSGSTVVFAVARNREVGVDVEEIRDAVDVDGVARRLFTAQQRRELAEMAPAARTPAFFGMWTRTEAYVKATGTGLAGTDRGDPDRPSGWLLCTFNAGPGYAAAVAVEGDGVEVPPAATDLSFS